MENGLKPSRLQQYIKWRDHFLEHVTVNICEPCNKLKKLGAKLDYRNPLNCGCRCEQVVELINRASNLDADIKQLAIKQN